MAPIMVSQIVASRKWLGGALRHFTAMIALISMHGVDMASEMLRSSKTSDATEVNPRAGIVTSWRVTVRIHDVVPWAEFDDMGFTVVWSRV
jgi:hypothetical protein